MQFARTDSFPDGVSVPDYCLCDYIYIVRDAGWGRTSRTDYRKSRMVSCCIDVGECNSPVRIRFLMVFLFLIIVSVIIYTSFEMPAGAEHLEQPTIEAEKSDAVQWLPDLEGLVRSIAKHGIRLRRRTP